MKEKTTKDLGLDEGDEYLKRISLEYDLGDFGEISSLLKDDTKKDENEAKKMIDEMNESV